MRAEARRLAAAVRIFRLILQLRATLVVVGVIVFASLNGSAAGDTACTIMGTSGNDVLDGGAGKDTLEGGAGHDVFLAGPGNDSIRAWDGQRDIVNGGSGTDQAWIDRTVDKTISVERK